MKKMDVGSLIS